MDPRARQLRAAGLPFALLAGAFRFLGWLNGGAALGLAAFSLGIVGGDIAAPDLQLPLLLLLAGLLLACLGVLFAYLAQVSLLRRRRCWPCSATSSAPWRSAPAAGWRRGRARRMPRRR